MYIPRESLCTGATRIVSARGLEPLIVVLMTTSAPFAVALADDQPEASARPARAERLPTKSDRPEMLVGTQINHGTVIIGGRLLSPPYRVSRSGSEVFINDEHVATLRGARNASAHENPDYFVATLERRLSADCVLFAMDERTHVFASQQEAVDFIDSLIKANTLEEQVRIACGHGLDSMDDGR